MGHMGNVAYLPSRSTWGQGNEAYGQWGTWEIGHMSKENRVMDTWAMGTWVMEHIDTIMHG